MIVTMGGDPLWAVGQVAEIEYAIDRPQYRRGSIRTAAGLRSRLVGVPHPSARGASRWALGQAELVADLAADPLG